MLSQYRSIYHPSYQRIWIMAIKKAIKLCKYSPEAYYNMGLTKCKMGQFEDAIEDYTKSIELNPNFGMAYYQRGKAYIETDSLQFAKSDFQKALEIYPANKEIKNDFKNLKEKLNKMLEKEEIYY